MIKHEFLCLNLDFIKGWSCGDADLNVVFLQVQLVNGTLLEKLSIVPALEEELEVVGQSLCDGFNPEVLQIIFLIIGFLR